MNKPNKARWIERKLADRRKPLEEEMYRIYQSKLEYDPIGAEIYLKEKKRYIENVLAPDRAHLEDIYHKLYEMPRAVVEKKVLPKISGIEKYAKTRTKAANEMFNLQYLVDDTNPKQFVRFVKATHGRTLKKMLNNNIKFAQSQGAKNWTTRAKKFVANFKGTKEELAYQFAERYGNKLSQYSGDLLAKNKGSMVKASERLTKSGKIRKRYAKRNPNKNAIKIIDANRTLNLEKAMYRMFKIDNRGKEFDNDGNGVITRYWLNRIRDFSTIPRAGLDDLEEQFFESIRPLGIIGNQEMYQVKLSPLARKVLERSRKQAGTARNKYGTAFVELYKRDSKE